MFRNLIVKNDIAKNLIIYHTQHPCPLLLYPQADAGGYDIIMLHGGNPAMTTYQKDPRSLLSRYRLQNKIADM